MIEMLKLPLNACLKDAISVIDRGKMQIALVIDIIRLKGIVTDGDIRRALLNGYTLATLIDLVML